MSSSRKESKRMIKTSISGINIANKDLVDKSVETIMKYDHWLEIVVDNITIYNDYIVTIEFFRQLDKWYTSDFARRQAFKYDSLDSEIIMFSIIPIDSNNWKFDNPHINLDALKINNEQCQELYLSLKRALLEITEETNINVKQVERYKKIMFYFRLITVPLAILLLIGMLIVVLRNNDFGTDDLVAIIVFGTFTLLMIGMFTFLDSYRYRIIKKQYGSVSEEDKTIAKDLLLRIDDLYQNEYEFLDHPQFQEYEESCKIILKQLIKGRKVYKGLFEPFVNAQEIINNMEEKEREKYPTYNNYLGKLVEITLRNQSDI